MHAHIPLRLAVLHLFAVLLRHLADVVHKVELSLAVGVLVDLGPANPDGNEQDDGNNCGKLSHAQPPECDLQKKSRPISKQLT